MKNIPILFGLAVWFSACSSSSEPPGATQKQWQVVWEGFNKKDSLWNAKSIYGYDTLIWGRINSDTMTLQGSWFPADSTWQGPEIHQFYLHAGDSIGIDITAQPAIGSVVKSVLTVSSWFGDAIKDTVGSVTTYRVRMGPASYSFPVEVLLNCRPSPLLLSAFRVSILE